MKLFDTHFHISSEADPREYAARSEEAQVGFLMAVGADYRESCRAMEFVSLLPCAGFSAGIHPHEADAWNGEMTAFANFSKDDKFAAVGEIGLDYYYEHSEREIQRRVFQSFLDWAGEIAYPVIVHCRDRDGEDTAYREAFDLLKEFSRQNGQFVLHCYTGTREWVEKFLELGAYFGFTGIVTFPKAENVREALQAVPLDHLLLETDSPYLTPMPHRGHPNHSAYLPLIADAVAREKDLPVDEIARITTKNSCRFFGLLDEIEDE